MQMSHFIFFTLFFSKPIFGKLSLPAPCSQRKKNCWSLVRKCIVLYYQSLFWSSRGPVWLVVLILEVSTRTTFIWEPISAHPLGNFQEMLGTYVPSHSCLSTTSGPWPAAAYKLAIGYCTYEYCIRTLCPFVKVVSQIKYY